MEVSREELLVGRVVAREEQPPEWDELRAIEADDPAIWARLCAALEDDALVRHAAVDRVLAADSVELPLRRPRSVRFSAAWLAASGWAAALVLALLWWSAPAAETPAASDSQVVETDADVIGELPHVVVSTEPTADGQFVDVVYVRRLLQRARVPELFQVHTDECGRSWPIAVQAAAFHRPESF